MTRDNLIEKLADAMDPDNARQVVTDFEATIFTAGFQAGIQAIEELYAPDELLDKLRRGLLNASIRQQQGETNGEQTADPYSYDGT